MLPTAAMGMYNAKRASVAPIVSDKKRNRYRFLSRTHLAVDAQMHTQMEIIVISPLCPSNCCYGRQNRSQRFRESSSEKDKEVRK